MADWELQLVREPASDAWYVTAASSTHARNASAQVITLEDESERLVIRLASERAGNVCLFSCLEAHADTEVHFDPEPSIPLTLKIRLPASSECSMIVNSPLHDVRSCLQHIGFPYLEMHASVNARTRLTTLGQWALPVWYWLHRKKMKPRWECCTVSWTATLTPAVPSDVDERFSQCRVNTFRALQPTTRHLDAHWTKLMWTARIHAVRSLVAIDHQIKRYEACLEALAARRESGYVSSSECVVADEEEEAELSHQLLQLVQERIRRTHVSTSPTVLNQKVQETLLCAAAEEIIHARIRSAFTSDGSALPSQVASMLNDFGGRIGLKLVRIVGVGLGWKALIA